MAWLKVVSASDTLCVDCPSGVNLNQYRQNPSYFLEREPSNFIGQYWLCLKEWKINYTVSITIDLSPISIIML